jgi:hypothetical protein
VDQNFIAVNDKVFVKNEGVYYTYFIYESVPNVEKSPVVDAYNHTSPSGQHLLGIKMHSRDLDTLKPKYNTNQTALISGGNSPHIKL